MRTALGPKRIPSAVAWAEALNRPRWRQALLGAPGRRGAPRARQHALPRPRPVVVPACSLGFSGRAAQPAGPGARRALVASESEVQMVTDAHQIETFQIVEKP